MDSEPLDIDLLRARDPLMTQRFYAIVRRFTHKFFATPAEAESAALEAIAEMLGKLEGGADPVHERVWALTAASNAVKRLQRQRRITHEELESNLDIDLGAGTPLEILGCEELLSYLERELQQLTSTVRFAVIATGVDGRTIESVATELGIPAGTVRQQLSRARRRFRQDLSDREKLDLIHEVARRARREQAQGRAHLDAPLRGPDDSSMRS